MRADKKIIGIEIGNLIGKICNMKEADARLVQICCVKEPSGQGHFELHYTFDIRYQLTSYKVTIETETEIPSITGIYPCAFLYENEMHDLYGIRIKDINIDYKGTFYKLAKPRPFNPEPDKHNEATGKAERADGKQS
jgi:ech hydrogenase subunit D